MDYQRRIAKDAKKNYLGLTKIFKEIHLHRKTFKTYLEACACLLYLRAELDYIIESRFTLLLQKLTRRKWSTARVEQFCRDHSREDDVKKMPRLDDSWRADYSAVVRMFSDEGENPSDLIQLLNVIVRFSGFTEVAADQARPLRTFRHEL